MTYQGKQQFGSKLVALGAAACMIAGLSAVPSAATTKTEQTFGSWNVTCVQDGASKRCQLAQSRVAGQKRQVVFVWSVSTNPSKQLMNSIMVPPGVSIKEGVRVSVGNKPPTTVPYDVCGARGCIATFPMDAATLQAMSTSPTASSNYVMANRKLQQVQVDLKEFPKAYEYFKSQLTSQ